MRVLASPRKTSDITKQKRRGTRVMMLKKAEAQKQEATKKESNTKIEKKYEASG